MKKSNLLLIIILIHLIVLIFNTDNLNGLIIKIQYPIYLIGYFVVKQLEENNTNK